jgi:hypothetical protein
VKTTDDAWLDYRADKLTDPIKRYTTSERDIFEAGWVAAQKRHSTPVRESVWVSAPRVDDDDPE